MVDIHATVALTRSRAYPLGGMFPARAVAALIAGMSEEAGRLLEMIVSSERIVALTGAGISTASGIPDFRSAGGIWESEDPMEVATLSVFSRDPERFWAFYRARLDLADSYEPNAGHLFLAHLSQAGKLSAVVTQNIDGLHQAAGVENGLVHEVHGSSAGTRLPRLRSALPAGEPR